MDGLVIFEGDFPAAFDYGRVMGKMMINQLDLGVR